MHAHDPGYQPAPDSSPDQERERRLELLVRRLPHRIQSAVRWLRRPAARWVRIPAGLLLMAASLLSILPIFGLWMLPLGLVLLAEDVPPLRHATGRLAWIEHRHPHWLGPPELQVREGNVMNMDKFLQPLGAAGDRRRTHAGR